MQSVAEKRLLVYLLMSNCGSRGDVDKKPSVSETFFKMWTRNGLRNHRCLEKKSVCGSNQLFGSCFSPRDFDVSAVNGAGEGARAQI